MSDKLYSWIDKSERDMLALQTILTGVPALAPENGGDGESEKAKVLINWLKEMGVKNIEEYNAPDYRVSSSYRPNIIASIEGESNERCLWIMSHLDVVPPGELDLWENDPYHVVEKDGKLFGRGVEDNQQGLVSSVFAMLSFLKNGIKPAYNVKLLFVADEEVACKYGIIHLLKNHNIFNKKDLFLVPDVGQADSRMIEVAEKSVLWLRFKVSGKQCHASVPNHGVNSFAAASKLVVELDKLHEVFSQQDDIYDPPISTFVPTKKEANVPNINTIPGEDVFYMDCRILPSVNLEDVLSKVKSICESVAKNSGSQISFSVEDRVESVPTDKDCKLVKMLIESIKDIYKVEANPVGMGGGTVAAYLRNEGYDTVCWATLEETAHMPNEFCIIDNMRKDSKVMASLMLKK